LACGIDIRRGQSTTALTSTHTHPRIQAHTNLKIISQREAPRTQKKQQEKDIGGHALASLPTSTLAASI